MTQCRNYWSVREFYENLTAKSNLMDIIKKNINEPMIISHDTHKLYLLLQI